MHRRLKRLKTKLSRVLTHTQLSFTIYRYRYLATFTLIGMSSIVKAPKRPLGTWT